MARVKVEMYGGGGSASGVKMYLDGERLQRVEYIDGDDSKRRLRNLAWKDDCIEFEADVELTLRNGNKRVYLTNIREIEYGKYKDEDKTDQNS